jgi:hypothetical protein
VSARGRTAADDEEYRMRIVNTTRQQQHTQRTAALTAHSGVADGYTAAEHERALDRLMADLLALEADDEECAESDENTSRPNFMTRAAAEIEPKLRITEPMSAAIGHADPVSRGTTSDDPHGLRLRYA